MPNSKSHLKVCLLAVAACFLWSTAFFGIKLGTSQGANIDKFSFAGIRFIISGLMLAPAFLIPGVARKFFRHFKGVLIVALVQTFLLYTFFYSGMAMAPGGLSSIIIGSQPLLAAVITHFMMHNEKMTLGKVATLMIGFTGIFVMVLSRQSIMSDVGSAELQGIGLLMLASIVAILANIVVVKIRGDLNPLVLNAGQLFIGGCMLLVLGVCSYGTPQVSGQSDAFYGTLLWLAFVSAGACSLWFYALKMPGVKVSELNTWKFMIPVSGATLCWCFLPDESLDLSRDWGQLVGMACVAISIISYNLIVLRRAK